MISKGFILVQEVKCCVRGKRITSSMSLKNGMWMTLESRYIEIVKKQPDYRMIEIESETVGILTNLILLFYIALNSVAENEREIL